MKQRRPVDRWLRSFNKRLQRVASLQHIIRSIAWLVLFTAVLTAILATQLVPEQLSLSVGQPAPQDIKAPREFVDRPETERLQREAAAQVNDIYHEDEEVNATVIAGLRQAFAQVYNARQAAGTEPDAETVERLRRELAIDIPDDVAMSLLTADGRTMQQLEQAAENTALELLGEGIKTDSLESARRRVPEMIRVYEFAREHERFVSLLVQQQLQPNLMFDEEATRQARQAAIAAVEPVLIRSGQILIREGEPVTADDLIRLQDAGLLRDERPTYAWLGAALMAASLFGLVAGYLALFHKPLLLNRPRLVLIGFTIIASLLIAWVVLGVSGYAVPLAAGAMLLAILIDARLAVFVSLLLAAIVTLLAEGDLSILFVTIIGSLAAVYSVTVVRQHSDLMRAGVYTALANAVTIMIWSALFNEFSIYRIGMWEDVFWGAVGGLLSAILTIGSLPFLESIFGIITAVRLLELTNPNQPLLRRLLVEAPGSYHHSLMVANLCEAAAEQVNADSLLARVGAYYHDIGKMKRPYFFVENQFGNVNPHDKLSPSLSALVIISHVKDGVELARQHQLPEELIRFIQEHHGTTRLEYFYQKAVEELGEKNVLEEDFRYSGPKPRSKETAICMLADSCEAAVRAMTKPSPGRIEATVRRIIRERLNEGQLDECDLTLADLNRIAETFTRVLTGIFHARIEYPETMVKEELERRKNGHGGESA